MATLLLGALSQHVESDYAEASACGGSHQEELRMAVPAEAFLSQAQTCVKEPLDVGPPGTVEPFLNS